MISIVTLTVGVIQLGFNIPEFNNKIISVLLIFIALVAIFVNQYGNKKKKYVNAGIALNTIYQQLRTLYFKVEDTEEDDKARLQELEQRFDELTHQFSKTGVTHQIMFSDWYAHYKFFVQLETDWIEKQRPFKFKDKIPLGLRWVIFIIIASIIVSVIGIIM